MGGQGPGCGASPPHREARRSAPASGWWAFPRDMQPCQSQQKSPLCPETALRLALGGAPSPAWHPPQEKLWLRTEGLPPSQGGGQVGHRDPGVDRDELATWGPGQAAHCPELQPALQPHLQPHQLRPGWGRGPQAPPCFCLRDSPNSFLPSGWSGGEPILETRTLSDGAGTLRPLVPLPHLPLHRAGQLAHVAAPAGLSSLTGRGVRVLSPRWQVFHMESAFPAGEQPLQKPGGGTV